MGLRVEAGREFGSWRERLGMGTCEDRVLDGPASGKKGSKGTARPQSTREEGWGCHGARPVHQITTIMDSDQ